MRAAARSAPEPRTAHRGRKLIYTPLPLYSKYDPPLLRPPETETFRDVHWTALSMLDGTLQPNVLGPPRPLSEDRSIHADEGGRRVPSLDDRVAKAAEDLILAQKHQKPWQSYHLARLLFERYCQTGAAEDLDQAIQTVPRTLHDHSKPLGRFDRQSDMLLASKGLDPANLGEAEGINENQDPVITFRTTDENSLLFAQSGPYVSSLAGEAIDTELAIVCQNNLACYLGQRYLRAGDEADIEEAIQVTRSVLYQGDGDATLHAGRASNLAVYLGDRYARNGKKPGLREALSLARQAVRATPESHPQKGRRINNLATLAADLGPLDDDFFDPLPVIQCAVDLTSDSDSHSAVVYYNSARLHEEHINDDGDEYDIQIALDQYVLSLNNQSSWLTTRILAGRGFLSLPNSFDNADRAFAVAGTCAKLLSGSITFSLKTMDKLWILSHAGGLIQDAAAAALHAGKSAFSALELLETGRGTLMTSLRNLRVDYSSLDGCDSSFIQYFSRMRTQFDGTQGPLTPRDSSMLNNPHSSDGQVNRRMFDSNLHKVIEKIRGTPMFETFFNPPSELEMLNEAHNGPIVTLNISSHRCDALIIQSSGISNLELSSVTLEEVQQYKSDPMSTETMEWLWDNIVFPVLAYLDMTEQVSTTQLLPHIWWVPTGPITGAPLHAAGYHFQENCETALDKVISSYSLSVTAIVRTRQQKSSKATLESTRGVSLLVEPCPEGQTYLDHAMDEFYAVRDACESMGIPCTGHESGSLDCLLKVVGSCDIFHFIGHAAVDAQNPLLTSLLISSGITIKLLLDINASAEPPFLAYLSACGTSEVRDSRLADESIHLASVFQLVGFRHVIATLWEADDRQSASIAKRIYAALSKQGLNDESVSRALHCAVRELRDAWVVESEEESFFRKSRVDRKAVLEESEERKPSLWIPFVHYGV